MVDEVLHGPLETGLRCVGVAAAVTVGRPLGGPRLAERTAEEGLGVGRPRPIAQHEEAEGLAVGPRRRAAGGEHDRRQLGVGDRVGPETADGPGRGQALEESDAVGR